MKRILIILATAIAFVVFALPAYADDPITVTSNRFTNNFRKNLQFQLEAQSSAGKITQVALLVQMDGGCSSGRQLPEFTADNKISATYEWNLERDYLPPGANGQFWWMLEDDKGNQKQTDKQAFRVEDTSQKWKKISNDKLALYWYAGSDTIAESQPTAGANVLWIFIAGVFAIAALSSGVLALIFRRRRALLVTFVVLALLACGTIPVWLYRYYDESRPVAGTRTVSFGQALFDRGVEAMKYLQQDTGATVDRQIQIFVYGNRLDFKRAIPVTSNEWTGGQAFPEHRIIVIDIDPNSLEWGKSATTHELTHQVIHRAIQDSCGAMGELSMPHWMDEGLAVYYETYPGTLDAQFAFPLRRAIQSDALVPIRTLAGAFPADSSAANLAYAESYSVVDFIFRKYGREKMAQLLQEYKKGGHYDDIFQRVLGVDTDGLDNAWRQDIGAKTRTIVTRPATTPTAFPTFGLSTDTTPVPRAATPTPTR